MSEFIFISVRDFIPIKDKFPNKIPVYVSDGDDMVFCDTRVYEELLEKTNNFTIPINANLIMYTSR